MSPAIGFTLREDPAHVQRLGFWWNGEDNKHHGFEFAHVENDPFLTAQELRSIADAIERRAREIRSTRRRK